MPFFAFFPTSHHPRRRRRRRRPPRSRVRTTKAEEKETERLVLCIRSIFFLVEPSIPSFGYPKGRGWRRTLPAGSHLRRRTLPRLQAALLVQARARIAISEMTRSSSSLPLFQPPLRVHPLPTKTRDCWHLNPILLRTTHSSSWHSSRCCRPKSNSNNGPTEPPPPRPLPLRHLTPPVLLRPAFQIIRFHGPTMRLPPPPTAPPPHPDPRLGAPATLHPRSSPVGTRQPTQQRTTTSWPHSV